MMKFDIVDQKTNKLITQADFDEMVGGRDIGLENLFINKDGIGLVLLKDSDVVPFCLSAYGITAKPKNITNFEWIKQMDKDELAKVVRSQGKEYHKPCAYAELDNCEMKCEEGFRKWLDQEVE